MSENLKQFEKWLNKYPITTTDTNIVGREDEIAKAAWQAALEMIYYKGVLESSLAGDLIKEELPDGSI